MNNIQTQESVFLNQFLDLPPEIREKLVDVIERTTKRSRPFAPNLALTCKPLFEFWNAEVHVVTEDNLSDIVNNLKKAAEYSYVDLRALKINKEIFEQLLPFLQALENVVGLAIGFLGEGVSLPSFPSLESLYIQILSGNIYLTAFQPKLRSIEIDTMEAKSTLYMSYKSTPFAHMENQSRMFAEGMKRLTTSESCKISDTVEDIETPNTVENIENSDDNKLDDPNIYPALESFILHNPAARVFMEGLILPCLSKFCITGHYGSEVILEGNTARGLPITEILETKLVGPIATLTPHIEHARGKVNFVARHLLKLGHTLDRMQQRLDA